MPPKKLTEAEYADAIALAAIEGKTREDIELLQDLEPLVRAYEDERRDTPVGPGMHQTPETAPIDPDTQMEPDLAQLSEADLAREILGIPAEIDVEGIVAEGVERQRAPREELPEGGVPDEQTPEEAWAEAEAQNDGQTAGEFDIAGVKAPDAGPSQLESFGRGTSAGLTFGLSPEFSAIPSALSAGMQAGETEQDLERGAGAPPREGVATGRTAGQGMMAPAMSTSEMMSAAAEEQLGREEGAQTAAQEAHPGTFLGGELTGAAVSTFAGGGGLNVAKAGRAGQTVKQGMMARDAVRAEQAAMPFMSRMGQAAKAAAPVAIAEGALSGAGHAAPGEQLEGAAMGGATGAVLGPALGMGGEMMMSAARPVGRMLWEGFTDPQRAGQAATIAQASERAGVEPAVRGYKAGLRPGEEVQDVFDEARKSGELFPARIPAEKATEALLKSGESLRKKTFEHLKNVKEEFYGSADDHVMTGEQMKDEILALAASLEVEGGGPTGGMAASLKKFADKFMVKDEKALGTAAEQFQAAMAAGKNPKKVPMRPRRFTAREWHELVIDDLVNKSNVDLVGTPRQKGLAKQFRKLHEAAIKIRDAEYPQLAQIMDNAKQDIRKWEATLGSLGFNTKTGKVENTPIGDHWRKMFSDVLSFDSSEGTLPTDRAIKRLLDGDDAGLELVQLASGIVPYMRLLTKGEFSPRVIATGGTPMPNVYLNPMQGIGMRAAGLKNVGPGGPTTMLPGVAANVNEEDIETFKFLYEWAGPSEQRRKNIGLPIERKEQRAIGE